MRFRTIETCTFGQLRAVPTLGVALACTLASLMAIAQEAPQPEPVDDTEIGSSNEAEAGLGIGVEPLGEIGSDPDIIDTPSDTFSGPDIIETPSGGFTEPDVIDTPAGLPEPDPFDDFNGADAEATDDPGFEVIEVPRTQPGETDSDGFAEEVAPGSRVAVLRALEKITGRITDLDVLIGDTVAFKSLDITAHMCDKRPPEETPETTAFLQIDEERPSGDIVRVFSGWMFASSPALNALEHPVYDVWVIDCKMSVTQ